MLYKINAKTVGATIKPVIPPINRTPTKNKRAIVIFKAVDIL
jgi:hypothetical protein